MPVRLVSQEELPAPLDGYRLIERLGRGGFGEVWKVEAPGGLLKAIKFVFGDLDAMDEESRPAEQELKALDRVKSIRHPYILSLERSASSTASSSSSWSWPTATCGTGSASAAGRACQGIPRDELMRYMEETAEALDLMNNHYQIQHLDIKPQNLFLVFNHVKVADFGLAKMLEGVQATVTGGVTPVYAAPETFEGWVSRFSDQYSLAIVFQELLTGRRPFNGANTRQLLMQHINGTPDLSSLPLADRAMIGRGAGEEAGRPVADLHRAGAGAEDGRAAAAADARATPVGSGPAGPRLRHADHAEPGRARAGRLDPGDADGHRRVRADRPPTRPRWAATAPRHRPPCRRWSSPATGRTPRCRHPDPRPAAAGHAWRAGQPDPAHTLNRPAIFQTGRMGTLGIAPPEQTGDGTLFPALVVAVGADRAAGGRAAQAGDRATGTARPSGCRTCRILYIDTDPDTTAESPSSDNPAALTAREVVPARLNRSDPLHAARRAAAGGAVAAGRVAVQAAAQPRPGQRGAGVRPARPVRPLPHHRPAGAAGDRDVPDRRPAAPGRAGDASSACGPTARGRTSSPGWPAAPAAACSSTSPTCSATSCARSATCGRRWSGCSSSRRPTRRRRGRRRWATRTRPWPNCTTSSRRSRGTMTAFDKAEAPVTDGDAAVRPRRRTATAPRQRPGQVTAGGGDRRPRPVPRAAHPGRPRRRRGAGRVPQRVPGDRPGVPDVRPVPAELAAAGGAGRRHPPVRPAAGPAVDREGRGPPARAHRRVAGGAVGGAEAVVRGDRRGAGRRPPAPPCGRSRSGCSTRSSTRSAPAPRPAAGSTPPARARSSTSCSSWSASRSASTPRTGSLIAALTRQVRRTGEGDRGAPGGDGRDVPGGAAVPAARRRGGGAADRREAQAPGGCPGAGAGRPRPGGAVAVRPAVPGDRRRWARPDWVRWRAASRTPPRCSTCSAPTPASGSNCTSWTWPWPRSASSSATPRSTCGRSTPAGSRSTTCTPPWARRPPPAPSAPGRAS